MSDDTTKILSLIKDVLESRRQDIKTLDKNMSRLEKTVESLEKRLERIERNLEQPTKTTVE
ncbi:MAG: hypothetical protein ACXAC5_03975 [Promethearchaeota archaeon]|jgi:predicted  nucleic acid-binding Zn-ribbon protein